MSSRYKKNRLSIFEARQYVLGLLNSLVKFLLKKG